MSRQPNGLDRGDTDVSKQKSYRDEQGHFLPGAPAGPGRPPRAVELDYLRTMAEAISLDDWKAIVKRAVEDAKKGNAQAREFIASRLLGEGRINLMALALRDKLQISREEELEAAVEHERRTAERLGTCTTPLQEIVVKRSKAARSGKGDKMPTR